MPIHPGEQPATRPRTIAYLTSSYARATDTFIRDEVAWLRSMGDEVHTFSIRRPTESEVVSEAVAVERAATTYLLDQPPRRFVRDTLAVLVGTPRRFRRAVVEMRRLSRPGLRGRVWPVIYLVEASVLARELRRRQVDHLHDHIAEGCASVAMLASIISGVPFSITVHGPSEWDDPDSYALDVKASHASFVAVISEYTRGQLCRWIAVEDWPKVHVVRCGVSPEPVAEPQASSPARPTLVSVGRLATEKGHLVLLQALRVAVLPPATRVLIVGDGPARPQLEAYIRRHGLGGVVELMGWRNSSQVRELVSAATAFVMPSFAEGLPVSIMEAFALGKPVIATNVGAIGELVEPGRSGWLVAPGSPNALAAAVGDCLALSTEELQRMGDHGRAQVRVQHDGRAEAERLKALIHRPPGADGGAT